MKNKFDISILVPVYNEQDSIKILYKELKDNLDNDYSWELIFINDGSTDSSSKLIKELISENSNIKLISFLKNRGKSEALNIGFKNCKGKYIVTLDADLQDDPSEIENLINKINEGYDMVSGWKQRRKDSISKTFPSKIYNFILRSISGINLHDFNCGLKVYKSETVNVIKIYGGLHRFIPIIINQNGYNKICEVPVNHRERKFGVSKYGSSRLFHGFFDLITLTFFNKYLNRPLHFFGLFGLVFIFTGFVINSYLTYYWFQGFWINPHKNPLFFLGILLIIIGVQFFSIGLIGELIVRFNKDRANYIKIDE